MTRSSLPLIAFVLEEGIKLYLGIGVMGLWFWWPW